MADAFHCDHGLLLFSSLVLSCLLFSSLDCIVISMKQLQVYPLKSLFIIPLSAISTVWDCLVI